MNMKTLFAALVVLLVFTSTTALAQKSNKLRVLCWSEQTEPREIYPTGISGALADHLNKQKGIKKLSDVPACWTALGTLKPEALGAGGYLEERGLVVLPDDKIKTLQETLTNAVNMVGPEK